MSPVLSDHFFLSLKGDLWTMYFGSVDVYEDMPLISSVPHRDKILNCRSRRPDRQGSPPQKIHCLITFKITYLYHLIWIFIKVVGFYQGLTYFIHRIFLSTYQNDILQ